MKMEKHYQNAKLENQQSMPVQNELSAREKVFRDIYYSMYVLDKILYETR